jgi:transcriptional regulator GlxA family with amidase domain
MRPHVLLGSALLLASASALPATAAPISVPAASAPVAGGGALSVPRPKFGRARPLVAVVADNAGVQTSDFIVPYGVLKDSGVADVRSLSTGAGPIPMTRGLKIITDETIAQFDAREGAGADIVIVPAQAKPKSRALTQWLRMQAAKGATIISVCEGSRVLAHAGLLQGKRAVSHWASLADLSKAYPTTTWVRDQRYLQDGPIITTSGVTAAFPLSLALIEAIAGQGTAAATARRFGIDSWGTSHRTADFRLTESDRSAAAQAQRATQETTEIRVDEGVDEVSLALQVEAWGRSLRTKVLTTRAGKAPLRSKHGLIILPDAEPKVDTNVVQAATVPALTAFEATLGAMSVRYGPSAARFAVLGMEYDRKERGQ